MTQRASESLVAALIRIGLLLALAILLMAENAQAQPLSLSPSAGSMLSGPASPQACSESSFRHSIQPDR